MNGFLYYVDKTQGTIAWEMKITEEIHAVTFHGQNVAAIIYDSSGTETLIYIRNAATFDPAEYNRLGY